MKRLAVLALLACLGLGAAPADPPTREEEKLLLELGKELPSGNGGSQLQPDTVCYMPDRHLVAEPTISLPSMSISGP